MHRLAASILLFASLATGRAGQPCARCHPSETAAFEQSPMGRSIGPPSVFAEGRIVHQVSGSTITIQPRGSLLEHKVEEHGLVAKYPVAYSVGDGIVGYSYMVRLGQYLYQSPASYYTQTKSWDLTPGYETEHTLDFTHQISSGCLFCHTGSVNFIAGTSNQFGEPAFTPISCDRCHGSPAAHLKDPAPGSIVNPAKLAPSRRDSVCEQCHLEGVVRILNPGRDWWDFQAGQAAESVFVTYLRAAVPGTLRAVSQSELLAQSRCARQSGGRLWCGTCHDPHASERDRPQAVRQVCLSCHGDLFAAGRHQAAAECVSCHMPRLTPNDIPHAASTDHRILRRPAPLPTSDNPMVELTAWQPPPAQFRDRDQALAALIVGGTHGLQSLHDKGAALLEALPQAVKDNDPAVLSGLVSVRLQRREPEQALAFARRALEVQPDSGFSALSLSIALQNSGDEAGAEKMLLHTIDLDPSLQAAWINLAFLYERQGRQPDRIALLNRYLEWNPQSVWFRQLKNMLSQPH